METAFLSIKELWMKTGKDSSILVNIDLVNYNLWYLVNALLPRRLYFDLDSSKLPMVILKFILNILFIPELSLIVTFEICFHEILEC